MNPLCPGWALAPFPSVLLPAKETKNVVAVDKSKAIEAASVRVTGGITS